MVESWTCIARKSRRVTRNSNATRDVKEGKKGKVQRTDTSEGPVSEEVPSPTQATSSQDSFAHAALSPNPPIPTPSSQEPTSQPTAPRKSTSQPAPSRKSVSQQLASQGSTPGALISRAPLPVVIDTPQAGVTSESLSVLGPSQPAVSPLQLVEPSRVPAMPPHVETSRRPGSTGRHMSHHRRHHICLNIGRTITCHTCIAPMAEP